ncbi:type 4a pilus biogenesis protein PilO [Undibacterium sp. CY18W]|uniref:Type 4a pilus biogenesis protein PilO n=1 Tax=Undibacterium hunanense TaxID=2762292 RepID=A0ABR6ZJC0_9BURK|nr:type 4a pilus biogenesis protein PilO [Undibacterium hunanense]MBC3915995.1 type 4a pilus biogenesis protein PilO [Undibacterium hunanense]
MTSAQINQVNKPAPPVSLLVQVALRAIGVANLFLLLMLVAIIVAWCWGIPYTQKQVFRLEERATELKEKKQLLQLDLKQIVSDENTVRLNIFYEHLGEKKYVEQQLKTVFFLATESGIAIKTGEYQLSKNNAGQYFTYRIQLPVKGSYTQLRKFVEQVLLTIPFASLDEISFKRETINGAVIDSKIVFTLFVTDEPASSSGNIE